MSDMSDMRSALVVVFALVAGCSKSVYQPGTLAGEAQGALESQTSLVTSTTVHTADGSENKREGVLQTLRDEQEHTRLYLARMKACGKP